MSISAPGQIGAGAGAPARPTSTPAAQTGTVNRTPASTGTPSSHGSETGAASKTQESFKPSAELAEAQTVQKAGDSKEGQKAGAEEGRDDVQEQLANLQSQIDEMRRTFNPNKDNNGASDDKQVNGVGKANGCKNGGCQGANGAPQGAPQAGAGAPPAANQANGTQGANKDSQGQGGPDQELSQLAQQVLAARQGAGPQTGQGGQEDPAAQAVESLTTKSNQLAQQGFQPQPNTRQLVTRALGADPFQTQGQQGQQGQQQAQAQGAQQGQGQNGQLAQFGLGPARGIPQVNGMNGALAA